MPSTDVCVIGAGPAGVMAALEAVKRNIDVIILEDHPVVGDPNHCSGLITKKGIDKLGVPYSSKIVDNSIDGVNFWSPNNFVFTINRKQKGELLVFQRNNLDRTLATYAESKGVEIKLNSKVSRLVRKDGRINGVVYKEKGGGKIEIRSSVVIDAEGANAKFLNEAGLKAPDMFWRMPAMQYELDNVPDFPRTKCELYHGSKWAPGFFAWIIPACKDSVRIGVATWSKNNTTGLLKHFYKKHPVARKYLKKSVITKKRGGIVTASGPISKSWSNGFLVVGDAAGQVKATTGGGVNIGAYCGRIAGTVAAQHVNKNMNLRNYENLWKREYFFELKLMEFIRKVLSRLSDTSLDILFQSASKLELDKKLNTTKDVDLHGFDLLKSALTPGMVKAGFKTSPDVLLSGIKSIIKFHGDLEKTHQIKILKQFS